MRGSLDQLCSKKLQRSVLRVYRDYWIPLTEANFDRSLYLYGMRSVLVQVPQSSIQLPIFASIHIPAGRGLVLYETSGQKVYSENFEPNHLVSREGRVR